MPVLKKNRSVVVEIADPLGNVGAFRINHLHPPFNHVHALPDQRAAAASSRTRPSGRMSPQRHGGVIDCQDSASVLVE
jgi:hypothetical protein